MSDLFSSLRSAAHTLSVLDRTTSVVQNNVANASSPGFARQRVDLAADRFDPSGGPAGGVRFVGTTSLRSSSLERAVQRGASHSSQAETAVTHAERLESLFRLDVTAGLGSSLTALHNSFSQLSVSPNDRVARETVLERARTVASSFRQTASDLGTLAAETDRDLRTTADQVNALAARIQSINQERRTRYETRDDPGLDAQLHATLDELAEQADFTSLEQPDGTVSVFLGGQTLLVGGEERYPISVSLASGRAELLDASGQAVTERLRGGRAGALLVHRNATLPAAVDDVNRLARSVAEEVNGRLAQGIDQAGNPPSQGLFAFGGAGVEAATLAITDLAPEEIAAAFPAAPGGNGNALQLAALADAPLLGGLTHQQYLAATVARTGREVAAATAERDTAGQLLLQARSLREQASGVDLNEEAAHLLTLQRSFQAVSKVVTILDEMTQTVLGLLR